MNLLIHDLTSITTIKNKFTFQKCSSLPCTVIDSFMLFNGYVSSIYNEHHCGYYDSLMKINYERERLKVGILR